MEIFRSLEGEKEASFIVYAVDSDIVKLFSSPSSVGPPGVKPNEGGYGKIFPNDNDTAATAIATLLAEHIFYELSKFPMLQLTPHAAETSGILDGIVRDLSRPRLDRTRTAANLFDAEWNKLVDEIMASEKSQIEKIADLLSSFKSSPKEQYDNALEGIMSLLLIKKHKLHNEMVRLFKLYAEQKLVAIAGFSHILDDMDLAGIPKGIFQDPNSMADWFFIAERTDYWKPLLRQNKNRTTLTIRIERDAAALAHLEFFNQKLARVGGRMILITGDRSLTDAVFADSSNEIKSNIIHPRSFLIEALERENSGKKNQRTFRTSLEFLLMEYTGSNNISIPSLTKLATGKGDTISDLEDRIAATGNANEVLYQDIFTEWEDQKDQIVTSRLLKIDSSQKLIISLIDKAKLQTRLEIEQALKEFQEVLEVDSIQQWNELSLSFSKAGLSILLALRGAGTSPQWRPRNPPSVVLDRFEFTQALISKLLETSRIEDLQPSLLELIEGISQDVKKYNLSSDHESYLTYLAFAVLSASEGKWYVSQVLAEKAIKYADEIRGGNSSSKITGREALYLLSQSKRISARSTVDVSASEDALKLSMERFSEELAQTGNGFSEELTIVKRIRFDSELISIGITKCHFSYWQDSKSVEADDITVLMEAIRALAKVILPLNFSSTTAKKYRLIIGTYLFVNAMQLVHLSIKSKVVRASEFNAVVVDLWNGFGKEMENQSVREFHVTYLMKAYQILFKVIFQRSRPIKEISALFNKLQIDANCVMVYDRSRFVDLAKLVAS